MAVGGLSSSRWGKTDSSGLPRARGIVRQLPDLLGDQAQNAGGWRLPKWAGALAPACRLAKGSRRLMPGAERTQPGPGGRAVQPRFFHCYSFAILKSRRGTRRVLGVRGPKRAAKRMGAPVTGTDMGGEPRGA